MSLSPFLIGQSRLLNHEAMVGLFSLISLLGILAYLYRGRRFRFLLVSAAAAGLAQLTKSSGMPIILLVMLVMALHAITTKGQPQSALVLAALKTLGLWLVMLAATYVIVWPGMWVAPLAMLQEVYGNAVSYALQGMRTSAAPGLETTGFELSSLLGGIGIYLNDLVWRTTPLTALGMLIALALGTWPRQGHAGGRVPLAGAVRPAAGGRLCAALRNPARPQATALHPDELRGPGRDSGSGIGARLGTAHQTLPENGGPGAPRSSVWSWCWRCSLRPR